MYPKKQRSPGDHLAPLPTNAWWQNLVLDDSGTLGENAIYPMPLLVKAQPGGLHVCEPADGDEVASVDFITPAQSPSLSEFQSAPISELVLPPHPASTRPPGAAARAEMELQATEGESVTATQ